MAHVWPAKSLSLCDGLVSVFVSSQGHDMTVSVVVARNTSHDMYAHQLSCNQFALVFLRKLVGSAIGNSFVSSVLLTTSRSQGR